MTNASSGRIESKADFNTKALDFLMRLRNENPPSDETVTFGAEIVAWAEEHGDISQVISFRYLHLQALQGVGRIDESLIEFPKLLAYCDRHPADDRGHFGLTAYKWMVYNARKFPQVTKRQIEGMLQDFEARLRREGLSLRPAHHARMDWAVALGNREAAAAHFREWQAAPRDSVTDCPACELHNRIEYLVFLRKDKEAVKLADPLLTGTQECTSVPDRTYGILLSPMLRLGREIEAIDLHYQGYRRIAGKRRYVDAAAKHITFLTRIGEAEEAKSVFEMFLPLALETTTPSKKFNFMLAGWLLLDGLLAMQSNTGRLRLPLTFDDYGSEAGYDLEALKKWFQDQTQKLAQSFDKRDETTAHSQLISDTIGTHARTQKNARVEMPEGASKFPPESWFNAAADGEPQQIAIHNIDGEAELVAAEWVEENVFRIIQHPLRVDGISRGDLVEARWDETGVTPRLTCMHERSGYRTIRVIADAKEIKKFLRQQENFLFERFVSGYRYEQGVLVFSIHANALDALVELDIDLRDLLPGEWTFTDSE